MPRPVVLNLTEDQAQAVCGAIQTELTRLATERQLTVTGSLHSFALTQAQAKLRAALGVDRHPPAA